MTETHVLLKCNLSNETAEDYDDEEDLDAGLWKKNLSKKFF